MFENVLNLQAKSRPKHLAISSARKKHDFQSMAADVRRCVGRLSLLRAAPGSVAAIHIHDEYTYWIIFFALEALGIVSIAIYPGAMNVDFAQFLELDLIFTEIDLTGTYSARVVKVDNAWVSGFKSFRALPLPQRSRNADDPICIVLSSGTTGTPKKVMFTRALLDRRVEDGRKGDAFIGDVARVASDINHATISGLMAGLCSWSNGYNLELRDPSVGRHAALLRPNVNVWATTPIHADLMLKDLPDDFPRKPDLAAFIFGGAPTKALIEEIQRRLTTNIILGYGTTETGAISQGQIELLQGAEDSAGFIDPRLEVEIVGPDGRQMATGEAGEIRVRGPGVVDGYYQDDQATAHSFRAGWYHPGDIGSIDESGVLRVLGRTDDLMNFGGAKLLPSEVERTVMRLAAVSEVAAFSAPSPGSMDALWIAYVAEAEIDSAPIRKALQNIHLEVRFLHQATLPRNMMGKVDRKLLRARAQAEDAAASSGK